MNIAKLILFGVVACISAANVQAKWDADVNYPTIVVGSVDTKSMKTSDVILGNGALSCYIYNIEQTLHLYEKHSFSLAGKGGSRDHYPRPRPPKNKDDLSCLPLLNY